MMQYKLAVLAIAGLVLLALVVLQPQPGNISKDIGGYFPVPGGPGVFWLDRGYGRNDRTGPYCDHRFGIRGR